MGCAHDSIKTVMQRRLEHDDLGESFFRVVDIEEICNVCDVVVYKTVDEKFLSYLKRLVRLQEQ